MRISIAVWLAIGCGLGSVTVMAQNLDTHPVRLDGDGKLLSWIEPQDKAYAHAAKISADFIKSAMLGPIDAANGLPVIYTHCEYDPVRFTGSGWPNHPAGRNAMLADSLSLYYQFSGDAGVLDAVKALLDYQLKFGATPPDYFWANVPWSTSAAGNPQYGTDNVQEGVGILEPDKIGELGFHGYLRFYEITGEPRYRDAAIACADALAKNIRDDDETHSPWPFSVDAKTGTHITQQYTGHVIAPIRLFDELIRLNLSDVAAYKTAREKAWAWLLKYPLQNNRWQNYFEDVGAGSNSNSQYPAGQTARYLLINLQNK